MTLEEFERCQIQALAWQRSKDRKKISESWAKLKLLVQKEFDKPLNTLTNNTK